MSEKCSQKLSLQHNKCVFCKWNIQQKCTQIKFFHLLMPMWLHFIQNVIID
jgi:hypothetical protein